MAPPLEYVVELTNLGILGKVVRAALRYGVTRLPVGLLPDDPNEVVLHFEAAGYPRRVSIVGERAGDAAGGLVPFRFRPRTRVQAAELFVISEEIPAPNESIPPPDELTGGSSPPSDPPPSDDTIVERVHVEAAREVPSIAPPRRSGAPPPTAGRPAPPAAAPSAMPSIPITEAAAEDPLLSRTIAGKYKLSALLGEGNAGAVYRGMHQDLGRNVAVKVLHARNQHEEQFVKRFKAEARAASRLDHRNVTRVLDFGQEPDGLLYLVMEYVAGKSLESTLQTEGRQRQERVVDIAIQVCNALVLAHKEGIIHRDIKPENLLLVPSLDDDLEQTDLVKVCDFGMAKLKSGAEEELTVGGMICGSPAYMSPEQIRGATLDARTDIYALGMTMYEALTGAHPFTAMTLVELFMKHENEKPRPPSQLVSGLDPIFEDIILRALAKRPEDRHDSARTLRVELRAVADQLRDDPAPPSSAISIR